MSESEEALRTPAKPEYQQHPRGGHSGRWRGRGRGRGGYRIDPSVAKALHLFGVTDLREKLNQKHQEENTNVTSKDTSQGFCERSRGEYRYSERGPQTRTPRSRSGEPLDRSSRGRGRYSSRSSERPQNSFKPTFIKSPSNITVKLTTSTGMRRCELDSETKISDIRHIPDYKFTDMATAEILNNSSVGRGRGRGVEYQERGNVRGRGTDSRGRENQFWSRGSEFRGQGNEFRNRGNYVRGRSVRTRNYRGSRMRGRGRGQSNPISDTKSIEPPPPNTEEVWDDVDEDNSSILQPKANQELLEQEIELQKHENEEQGDLSFPLTDESYDLVSDYEENEISGEVQNQHVDNSNDREDINLENIKINPDKTFVVTASTSGENKKRSVRFDLADLKDDSESNSLPT